MLSTVATTAPAHGGLELLGQTVVVIGAGAAGGVETARRARAEGADVVVPGRDRERLERAALEVDARRTAAFDATDAVALERFFDDVTGPMDHVVVTAADRALALDVARNAAAKIRHGGTLLLIGGPGPSITAALAVALAPVRVRVNMIALGPVDTPLPGARLDDLLAAPIGAADDVAALAVRLMAEPTLNGATYDADGARRPLPQEV